MNNQDTNRIIRRPELLHITGLSNSALDREVRDGRFPAPLKLSPNPKARAVGWSMRGVQEWIAEREAEAQRATA